MSARPYCRDCPDHEACSQGAPCDLVKRVNGVEPPADTQRTDTKQETP